MLVDEKSLILILYSRPSVGYQPEGVAVLGGKVYVANSGGYNWVHDNRISVVDLASFKLEKNIELPFANLNHLLSDGSNLWVNSYGESSWSQDEAGNWIQAMSTPQSLARVTPAGDVFVVEGAHSSMIALGGGYLFSIGNLMEMEGETLYVLETYNTDGGIIAQNYLAADLSYPYSIAVNPSGLEIFISDASFTGGSKVFCIPGGSSSKRWSVETGVGTGKMLIRQ